MIENSQEHVYGKVGGHDVLSGIHCAASVASLRLDRDDAIQRSKVGIDTALADNGPEVVLGWHDKGETIGTSGQKEGTDDIMWTDNDDGNWARIDQEPVHAERTLDGLDGADRIAVRYTASELPEQKREGTLGVVLG